MFRTGCGLQLYRYLIIAFLFTRQEQETQPKTTFSLSHPFHRLEHDTHDNRPDFPNPQEYNTNHLVVRRKNFIRNRPTSIPNPISKQNPVLKHP